MKSKYVKKDKRIKKSKTPKNSKKIVKAKKAARRSAVEFDKSLPENLPPGKYEATIRDVSANGEKVTLGFESSAAAPIEPEALADSAAEAQEPTPDVEVPA